MESALQTDGQLFSEWKHLQALPTENISKAKKPSKSYQLNVYPFIKNKRVLEISSRGKVLLKVC